MIGVTIGIGRFYERSAALAAACLKKHTGIESIILNHQHLTSSGLLHPAALKLRLFDIIVEDSVLYYDADWFCVNHWKPAIFAGHPNIVACHDFVLTADWPHQTYDNFSELFNGEPGKLFLDNFEGEIRIDYICDVNSFNGLGLSPSLWINTGMFIVSRQHHAAWLRAAEGAYCLANGHHVKYYEQPAMMLAVEKLKLKVDFLPRRYNILVASARVLPTNVVGVHVKFAKRQEFRDLINTIEGGRATPETLEATIWPTA